MFQFKQSAGVLSKDGVWMARGYSGSGDGKNNPAMQSVHNVGPIPTGRWIITALTEGNTPHGPFVLHLHPCADTETFGRSDFLIHGDSVQHPGAASQGCIIMPRAVREAIWASGDSELTVIA